MKAGRARPWLAIVLGLVAFALYLPSLKSGFVYDAEIQIQSDGYLHEPSHLGDVASLRVLGQDVLDGSRPAHLFVLMLDSLIWGRQPVGYHLTSNLFHALNVGLLFLLLSQLAARLSPGQSPPPRVLLAAALGALLLAVHPVLTEAVSEVSDREDPLATFFILCALLLAGHFPSATRPRSFLAGGACVLSLVLAAAAKETGFAGPFLLALYAGLFHRAQPRRPWIILLAVAFTAVGIFGAARFGLQPETSKIFTDPPAQIGGSLMGTLKIQPRIWAFLLANTAWPSQLSADYMPQSIAWCTMTIAIGILLVFLGLQLLLATQSRLAFFGASIFWLGLAPVSNFIPIFRPIADRFLYLPMTGLAAMLCAALLLPRKSWLFTSFCAAAATVILALIPLNLQRQTAFANSTNLWRDTLAKTPASPSAANNLGYALHRNGDDEGAFRSFQRAIQLSGGRMPDAWAGAAVVLDQMNRPTEAEASLEKAIAIDPKYAHPRQLIEAMASDPETTAALQKILDRMPSSPP